MVDDNTELEIIAKPSFAKDDNGNFRLDGEGGKIPNMFIGSYVTINGERKYLKSEEFTSETDADGNAYYKYNFNNISGRVTVELFFSEIYTVTYLSNGGEKYSVKSMGSDTGIAVLDDTTNVARFNERASGNYTATACNWKDSDSGTLFYGWEYVNPYSDDNATVFNPDINVTYDYDGSNDPQALDFVITGTLAGTAESKTITTNARNVAVLKARWYFKHNVIAQTKKNDGTYVNSSTGGYVSVNESDDIYKLSDIEYYGKTFYSFKDKTVTVTATAMDGYRFVGWYEKTADGETYINNRTSHTYTVDDSSTTLYAKFEHDDYRIRFHINDPSKTLANANTDVYAHWIDIGTVSKAEDDDKIGVNSYYGFDLFGTQIRNADDDENYPVKPSSFDKSGLRFVTSFSEKLLSDIDILDGTKTRPEYGYVLAKKSTAEKACENAGVTADNYELKYNGTNVNGKDKTARSSYGYVTNVNCTSSKSYSGIVPLDHFNSDNYRIFSLVITYNL